jgi:hypothetical protein
MKILIPRYAANRGINLAQRWINQSNLGKMLYDFMEKFV